MADGPTIRTDGDSGSSRRSREWPEPAVPDDGVEVVIPIDRRDADAQDGASTRPAGMCLGRGHLVVYGNRAFRLAFGDRAVGVPAREGLVGLSHDAFELLDAVLSGGRPLACWVRLGAEEWRMTAAPRTDPGTGEVYGLAFHLRARSDLPAVADAASSEGRRA
jgi:hypothetical protein